MNTSISERPDGKAVLQELERELQMRLRVYGRWVREGKMKQTDRDHRIACLDVAIEHFRGIAERERQASDLFGRGN